MFIKSSALLVGVLCFWDVGFAEDFSSEITTNEDRHINVSLNPFSLLSGNVSAGVEFRATHRMTIGPYINIGESRFEEGEDRTVGYGLRADYNMSGAAFNDGWYLSPFVSRYKIYAKATSVSKSIVNTTQLEYAATNVGAVVGYGWFWDSGLNLRLGVGAMHTKLDGELEYVKDTATTQASSQKNMDRLNGFLPTGELVFAWVI